MERPKVWYGFVFPWIAVALAWAQFSPYWGFGGSYNYRLVVGLAVGFLAAGLEVLFLHRIITRVSRRLARRDQMPPAA